MAGGSLRAAAREGGLLKSFAAIWRQEGILGYWRGNLPQVDVVPAAAPSLCCQQQWSSWLAPTPPHPSCSLPPAVR